MATSVPEAISGHRAFPWPCPPPCGSDGRRGRSARITLAGCVGWLVASCVLSIILGCRGGRSVCPVSGHVQASDGRRPTFGTVEFRADAGGRIASGRISHDGSFRLSTFGDGDGAVAGRHRAIIVQVVNTEHLPLEQHHHVLDVHPRYARYETSGLAFTIEPGGENYLEIVVDEAPRKAPRPPASSPGTARDAEADDPGRPSSSRPGS
jgi:hypothetical protein